MTDNEIIKALELCFAEKGTKQTCGKCPYHKFGELCKVKRDKDALDLINRQQEEIERLKAEDEKYPFKCVMPFNSMVCSKSIEDYDRLVGDIGADAIKEFWGKLKKHSRKMQSSDFSGEFWDRAVLVENGDNLEKEMVGEQE